VRGRHPGAGTRTPVTSSWGDSLRPFVEGLVSVIFNNLSVAISAAAVIVPNFVLALSALCPARRPSLDSVFALFWSVPTESQFTIATDVCHLGRSGISGNWEGRSAKRITWSEHYYCLGQGAGRVPSDAIGKERKSKELLREARRVVEQGTIIHNVFGNNTGRRWHAAGELPPRYQMLQLRR
jgi:hypothetical protein